MTRKRPQDCAGGKSSRRQLPAGRAVLIMALCGAVTASAACAGPLARVRLPARTTTPAGIIPAATTSAPAVMTARQQVLTALAAYTTALSRAEGSRVGAVARELLRPYLAAGRVDGLVEAMTAIWARHESFSGQETRHVTSLTVAGRRAFVHECDNTSRMSLVDIATGQIVPGSAGATRVSLVTRLELVGGHWLVRFQLVVDVPCVA